MPYDRLRLARSKTVGAKQTVKAIQKGTAETVYVAADADPRVTKDIVRESQDKGVPVETVESMQLLGKACGIAVGAAAAAIIKE